MNFLFNQFFSKDVHPIILGYLKLHQTLAYKGINYKLILHDNNEITKFINKETNAISLYKILTNNHFMEKNITNFSFFEYLLSTKTECRCYLNEGTINNSCMKLMYTFKNNVNLFKLFKKYGHYPTASFNLIKDHNALIGSTLNYDLELYFRDLVSNEIQEYQDEEERRTPKFYLFNKLPKIMKQYILTFSPLEEYYEKSEILQTPTNNKLYFKYNEIPSFDTVCKLMNVNIINYLCEIQPETKFSDLISCIHSGNTKKFTDILNNKIDFKTTAIKYLKSFIKRESKYANEYTISMHNYIRTLTYNKFEFLMILRDAELFINFTDNKKNKTYNPIITDYYLHPKTVAINVSRLSYVGGENNF